MQTSILSKVNITFQTEFPLNFRGELGSKLNQEQKTAAINIVQADNSPLPYLLFGPAGESLFDYFENVKLYY